MRKPRNQKERSRRVAESPGPANWKPNRIPAAERIFYLGLSVVLLAYGASGFIQGKLALSTSRGGGNVLMFYGSSAWLLASSVIVGAVLLLSVVVDHYDKRNNERWYQAFRRGALYVGLCLLGAAFSSFFYRGFLG